MQTRLFFVVVLAVLLAMTAFGQKFELDSEGRGIALTPEVQRLMDEADQVIAQTAPARAEADKIMAEEEAALEVAVIDAKSSLLRLFKAKTNYMSAIGEMISSRQAAGSAIHKVAMAYFDNVIAISNKKKELAEDNYGEWQENALTAKKFAIINHTLLEHSTKAIAVAREREAEQFRRFQEDFRRMQELDREMREKSKI